MYFFSFLLSLENNPFTKTNLTDELTLKTNTLLTYIFSSLVTCMLCLFSFDDAKLRGFHEWWSMVVEKSFKKSYFFDVCQ